MCDKIDGMKEHATIAGKIYTVTSPNGCTVTDETGLQLGTVEAGEQKAFTATGGAMWLDDTAARVTVNFNQAPVKLKLLGLLGGGVSTLPSGYLAAEYIEQPPKKQELDYVNAYIATDVTLSDDMSVTIDHTPVELYWQGEEIYILGNANNGVIVNEGSQFGLNFNVKGTCRLGWGGSKYDNPFAKRHYKDVRSIVECSKGRVSLDGYESSLDVTTELNSTNTVVLGAWRKAYGSRSKIHGATIKKGGKLVASYVPALDEVGSPCLYDTIGKKPFYNGAANEFIVGMTMEQARKLGKLPAGGGMLTVSLPSNYAEDEGVVNALATAQENGWKITIQTYEAEAGASSTFALRRIWVRKRTDEQGSYVDADGSRWQVEWCVDIVGADPEQEGYEPFRSVDVATEYWGLTPWVDPEAEEELLTNTEEV